MAKYVTKVLVTEEELNVMLENLGKVITEDYRGKQLVAWNFEVAFVFLSDLVRQIDIPLNIDFMSISS